jgi:glycosyltransferase involved in cell wall biosynthesis
MSAAEPCAVTIVANDVGAVGGMERVLRELIAGLAERGHEVTVVSRLLAMEPCPGVRFRRVPGPRRPFPLAYPWFMLVTSMLLGRWRRGVVLSTGAITLARVDAVAVHYCHQVGPTQTDRRDPLSRLNGVLTRAIKRRMERVAFAAAHARRFVCVSDGVAEEMHAHYPELAPRVMTIHNGVDTEAFSPGARRADAAALRERLGLGAHGRLVAAFVGGEWDRKGLAPALEALAKAPEWELLVAGAGDEVRYRALADSLGVGERVRWLGLTRDVAPVYEAADAFVFPSSYETFSLVTFEAAASGLPIVAAPVNGVRELIQDGHNGFLIEREPEQIAARLTRLGAEDELRERMGRAARESVARFSWSAMVERYHQLLQELAD